MVMKREQQPGGVAGRVLNHYYDLYDYYSVTERECQINGMCLQAVGHLTNELSREARVILGEWDSYIARIKDDTEMHPDEKDEVLAEAITEQSAQRRAFTRLGLDLESEEAE